MKGKVFEPSEGLRDFVMCYWSLDFKIDETPQMNTIIPDGTMKLIFHYGDLYWHHPQNNKKFLQPRSFLIGQLTKPYIVEPSGDTGTFVVRFHPNGFLPFTTIPIKQMENTPISLYTLYGKEGQELEQKILNSSTIHDRIKIIEEFLFKRLANIEIFDKVIKSAVDTILEFKGKTSVANLSSKNNIERRQLVRKFSKTIGLSPKQLSKIVRLQAVLNTLLNEKQSKFTDLVYDNEYYDQSHFIKDFKEFTGITPKEFYGESLKMSLIFEKEY